MHINIYTQDLITNRLSINKLYIIKECFSLLWNQTRWSRFLNIVKFYVHICVDRCVTRVYYMCIDSTTLY